VPFRFCSLTTGKDYTKHVKGNLGFFPQTRECSKNTAVRGMNGNVKKIYILDTNVLLHDPDSLFAFEDNDIVLPVSVIEELDNKKTRGDEIGRHAREVSRQLDALRSSGPLSVGVRIPQGGSIRIETPPITVSSRWPILSSNIPKNQSFL
jgi:PIN domain